MLPLQLRKLMLPLQLRKPMLPLQLRKLMLPLQLRKLFLKRRRQVASVANHLVVGAIVGPKGIRGQFKVKLFAESPDVLTSYGPLQVDDGQLLQLLVKSVNSKGLVIVSAAGVDSPEAVEALRGRTLSINRSDLPKLADNEIYHADIIGLPATDDSGELLGTIVALYNFGAGEIVEVKPRIGPSLMLPFHGDSVVAIELDNGQVILAPPAGLIDDEDGTDQAEV
jgi:16S rRNA processing protein RimM